jgi:PPM family protein phosphatase
MHDPKRMFKFDTASAISQGAREYQQDAIISDFANGADICFAVLSDGMGGHAAGDVASKIVVTEVFSALTLQRTAIAQDPTALCDILQNLVTSANRCLKSHMAAHPETHGMGATLVACVVVEDRLHWISVGDSPLFLWRDDALQQINEDHSLGPHIDFLVQSGALSAEEGANHLERNVLTSVLAGQSKLTQVDCPVRPLQLKAGDTIIVASDGLQFLTNDEISQTLRDRPTGRSAEIVEALMTRLNDLDDPDLDNIAVSLIQVSARAQEGATPHSAPYHGDTPDRTSRWPFGKRDTLMEVARRARARASAWQGNFTDGA